MKNDAKADEVGPNALAALAAMSDDDLRLVDMEAMGTDLALTNWALLEQLQGLFWGYGVFAASGLTIGGLWGGSIPPGPRLIVAFGLIIGAGVCMGGGAWRRRRSGRYLATAKSRQGWRAAIQAEREKRARSDV